MKEIKPIYPNKNFKSFCYIKSVVTNPNIIVGDYSYYDDSEDGPESFEKHVTHFSDFLGDKLIIGKFCCIAKGVEFVMNGANSVVGKDIPPYAIAVGNPVVIKKFRFDEETIALLEELKWWDKPIEEIKKLIPLLDGDLNESKDKLKELLSK